MVWEGAGRPRPYPIADDRAPIIGHPSGWTNWGIALLGLWVPAAINLAGLRQVAWFQNVTVVLKFLPLAFVGVVGWFFIKAANFGPFNASGGSLC